jgi:hypothetical protein
MAKRRSEGAGKGGSGEEQLVRMIRILTEEQFDFWIGALNAAVEAMGGRARAFTADDRQKTVSYWYVLMLLLEAYAARRNPFAVRKADRWLSDPLVTVAALGHHLGDRFKEETIRRYLFDLKQAGLITLDGRGAEATIRLAAPTILALASTIRQWVRVFRGVDRRIAALRIM